MQIYNIVLISTFILRFLMLKLRDLTNNQRKIM